MGCECGSPIKPNAPVLGELDVFGHITIRSAFRSSNVNGFGNCHNMNCSSNKASSANHIWDHKDSDGRWRGREVCMIRKAWLATGKGAASLAEQENWYRQEELRSSQS